MGGTREPIDPDKRYVRRDEQGRFDDVVDVGRSLSQDRKREAKHIQGRATGIEATGRAERTQGSPSPGASSDR